MKENDYTPPEKVACPFCGSTETEMIALFGMQMMTSQYYCQHCHSAFEAVKWTEPKPLKPGSK
jgi:transposase-like protein